MIDLRSDTSTRPTPEMREAIASAPVGDEQRGEDPSVNELCEKVARRLGQEAALFLPSGTMCNIVAIKTQVAPGEAIFTDSESHIVRFETGGPAMHSGAMIQAVPAQGGIFTADDLRSVYWETDNYSPVPRLLSLENTHNQGGGRIWPLTQYQEVVAAARELGLKVHLDGARLFNAAIASGHRISNYSSICDTVWVDFTKGLGAPLGAVLCGSHELIQRARRFKHAFGGALRQAGMMAAGCLYALQHHVGRLKDDHRRAARLAEVFREVGFEVEAAPTNIVFFKAYPGFVEDLEREGISIGASLGGRLRAVTHLDVNDQMIEQTVEVVRRLASKGCAHG